MNDSGDSTHACATTGARHLHAPRRDHLCQRELGHEHRVRHLRHRRAHDRSGVGASRDRSGHDDRRLHAARLDRRTPTDRAFPTTRSTSSRSTSKTRPPPPPSGASKSTAAARARSSEASSSTALRWAGSRSSTTTAPPSKAASSAPTRRARALRDGSNTASFSTTTKNRRSSGGPRRTPATSSREMCTSGIAIGRRVRSRRLGPCHRRELHRHERGGNGRAAERLRHLVQWRDLGLGHGRDGRRNDAGRAQRDLGQQRPRRPRQQQHRLPRRSTTT